MKSLSKEYVEIMEEYLGGFPASDIEGFAYSLDNPIEMVGRQDELNEIIRTLKNDEDLYLTGAPGSGRYSLIRQASKEVNAALLPINCVRARDGASFVRLFIREIFCSFGVKHRNLILQKLICINSSCQDDIFIVRDREDVPILMNGNLDKESLWLVFNHVISSIQEIINDVGGRSVILLNQFSHIRSWDRTGKWEEFLTDKVKCDPGVSYIILGTVAEEYSNLIVNNDNSIKLLELRPLPRHIIMAWARQELHLNHLSFDFMDGAHDLFLEIVQGHIGDARIILSQLILICKPNEEIKSAKLRQALDNILKDFSAIFETLLFMLPYSQLQLIECFAVESTKKPHKKDYREKYGLSKGGTLQAALKGLQQKGLIYGAEYGHQLTLPIFSYWIRSNKKSSMSLDGW